MKKFCLSLLVLLSLSAVFAENNVIYSNPALLTMTGKVGDRYVRWRSKEFPAKPQTWYRATAEIRTMMEPSDGRMQFRVRNVKPDGKSIVYATVALLKPGKLDFTTYSDVFMTRPGCAKLQVYMILDRINGQAQIRNIKIEELSAAEAEKILASKRVESAFFSPPVCEFAGGRSLFWGYRVSTMFIAEGKVPASVSISIPALKVNATAKVKPNDHIKEWVRIPRPMKPGRYEVTMKALDASGKTLLEKRSFLQVINRPAYAKRLPVKSVSIDSEGFVVVNGKRTIINGIYHAHNKRGAAAISEAGFNAAQTWAPSPASYKAVLDIMASNDIYANCVLKNIRDAKLAALMKAIKDHPAIFSWDIVDEPAIRNIKPAALAPCVTQVRALNTGRPLRISFSDPSAVKAYQACYDMPAVHKYVLPFDGLAKQGEIIRGIAREVSAGQSPQITLQSWVHWHDESQRPQTVEQTRSQAYLVLINGAKGFWWYHFTTAYKIPHIWGALRKLNAELYELEPVLTGKRVVLKSSLPEVEAAQFTGGGRSIVIMVNTANKAANVKLSGINGKTLVELFAVQPATVSGNEFTVAPEDTRIFEVK